LRNPTFEVAVFGLGMALAASAQSNGKIGVINIQAAISTTKDGQKAGNDLQARFGPRKTELDKRQSDIQQLQAQLAKATDDTARQSLSREIDQKTKAVNREMEDARAELDQQEQKIMSELGGRVMTVIEHYAKDHGYMVILDISSQQTPVVYASETINITKDVIDLYDKNAPTAAAGTQPPPVPAPKPAVPHK
jgi:outer membrane protein